MGVKSLGLTEELHPILLNLRPGGESGIHGGPVKWVDIVRNAGGESDFLDRF